MMAAEKWYEYQSNYQKYGFDMKPKAVSEKKERSQAKTGIGVRDKLHMLELLLVLGVLCIGLVISTAYSAKIQFTTNQMRAQCNEIQGEIQNLDVAVKSACGIEGIEVKASQLGMVYPSAASIAYVDCNVTESKELSLALKESAYPVN